MITSWLMGYLVLRGTETIPGGVRECLLESVQLSSILTMYWRLNVVVLSVDEILNSEMSSFIKPQMPLNHGDDGRIHKHFVV